MTLTRANGAAILTPEQVQALVINPVLTRSVAGKALTTQAITKGSSARFPIIKQDPTASWVAEGAEIPVSDADLDELDVVPLKLAGLTVVTHELASDSNPAAPQIIGDGLVRDLTKRLDQALFVAATTNGPAGLPSLDEADGVHTVPVTAWTDIYSAAVDADSAVEASGGDVSAWLFNPVDYAQVAKVTAGVELRTPLLGTVSDNTGSTVRTLVGAPILVSDQQPRGIAYGIDSRTAFLCMWEGATVESDTSAFFTSDRVAIRARLRANFAFPNPAGIARLILPATP